MKEMQELFCHGCDRYVQFEVDMEVNANIVLECPNCGHKHYRTVENGKITDARWDIDRESPVHQYDATIGSNGLMIMSVTAASTTAASTFDTYLDSGTTASTGTNFLYNSWLNTTGRN